MNKVLDKGFVTLIDHMGSDEAVCADARVSVEGGKRKKKISKMDDEKLIQYLIKKGHWSPFDHQLVKFSVKCPFTVARQWMRHRHYFNEISGRYSSTVYDDFYLPTVERMMTETTKDSKQGSGKIEDLNTAIDFRKELERTHLSILDLYNRLIDSGCSKELARGILPLHTYTEFRVTITLRSLIHFLSARLNQDAQWEIRQYAEELLKISLPLFPDTLNYCKELYKWD